MAEIDPAISCRRGAASRDARSEAGHDESEIRALGLSAAKPIFSAAKDRFALLGPSTMQCRASAQRFAEAAGEVLDELPGDAARARAAGDRPFVGLGPQLVLSQLQPVMPGVA